jgi:anti-sigma factor RsiW
MNDDDLWLDALLDDELDAAASLALQRRLAEEPALQRRLDDRRALRDVVRAQATRHAAPDALRANVMAMLAAQAGAGTNAGPGEGARAFAGEGLGVRAGDAGAGAGMRVGAAEDVGVDPRASLERRGSRAAARRRMALPWATGLGGALLASVLTLAVVAPGAPGWHRGDAIASLQTAEASEAVSAHTRALLVDHPIEVASSDQHTVRPWLSARLNFVPPVTDFAPQGYPLVGARRDVLSGETAAALVYRHGAHVISVFVRPVDPSATRAAEATRVVRGFNVIERTQGGLAFCFVSDANPHELAALADLVAPLAGS